MSIRLIIILACFIAISSLKSLAQNHEIIDSGLYSKSYFTLDLVSSIDIIAPRWRIGYIKHIDSDWKVGLNFGYGNSKIAYTQFLAEHYEDDFVLWEIRPELFYLLKKQKDKNNYISAELFYINHKEIFHNYYYYSKNEDEISYDKVNYQRHKFGLNLNYGEFLSLRNKLGLNYYAGLGIKFRDVSFSEIQNPKQSHTFIDMFDFDLYRKVEGLKVGLNISLGARLYF